MTRPDFKLNWRKTDLGNSYVTSVGRLLTIEVFLNSEGWNISINRGSIVGKKKHEELIDAQLAAERIAFKLVQEAYLQMMPTDNSTRLTAD